METSQIHYRAKCHCEKVKVEFIYPTKVVKAAECNCSICFKKGILHVTLLERETDFKILEGDNELTEYTFNTKTARHTFCKTCGICVFYYPRSHPAGVTINGRCIDFDRTDSEQRLELAGIIDGQNWETLFTEEADPAAHSAVLSLMF